MITNVARGMPDWQNNYAASAQFIIFWINRFNSTGFIKKGSVETLMNMSSPQKLESYIAL